MLCPAQNVPPRHHPGVPRVQRGPGFDDVRGGAHENGRPIAAADERDARAGTKPFELGQYLVRVICMFVPVNDYIGNCSTELNAR